MSRIGILGAGISGLTTGILLRDMGLGEVCVLEQSSRAGGLASSRDVEGYVFDLHGGHVFNSPDPEVRRHVFGCLPESEWIHQERRARILYGERVVDYPFEFALYQLPEPEGAECLAGFGASCQGPEPEDYHGWLVWRFGRPIAERYMVPYNEKIMAYDLARMSTRWVRGKMPLPSFADVERAYRTRDSRERAMPHAFFYYPRRGGIQALMDRMATMLGSSLRLNTPVECVEPDGSGWRVNGTERFDVLISTIPLRSLVRRMPQAPSDIRRAGLNLKTNATSITLCECAPQDMSWLYIPDKKIPVHRMVFQGGLSPENCPAGGMGSSVLLETTGRVSPEDQVRGLNARVPDALRVGRVIGHHFADAYILYDADYGTDLAAINSWLDTVGLFRVGRFAEWQYYNMDICVRRAMDLAARLGKRLGAGIGHEE